MFKIYFIRVFINFIIIIKANLQINYIIDKYYPIK